MKRFELFYPYYILGYAIIQLPELIRYMYQCINTLISRKNLANPDKRSITKQPRINVNTVDAIQRTNNYPSLGENKAIWGVISNIVERLEKMEEILVSSRNGENNVTSF